MPFLCKMKGYTFFYKMRVSCDAALPQITIHKHLKQPWPNQACSLDQPKCLAERGNLEYMRREGNNTNMSYTLRPAAAADSVLECFKKTEYYLKITLLFISVEKKWRHLILIWDLDISHKGDMSILKWCKGLTVPHSVLCQQKYTCLWLFHTYTLLSHLPSRLGQHAQWLILLLWL